MARIKDILFMKIDPEEARVFGRKIGLIPEYTEISLFLMGITFLLLVLTNKEARSFLFLDFSEPLVSLAVFCGLFFAIFNSFFDRKASYMEKFFMLLFAVLINVTIGISAGVHILSETQGLLVIFPAINIIDATLLLFFLRGKVITTEDISDKQAKFSELALGSTLVFLIFLISNYIFKNYWAITFSVCVAYASNINSVVIKYWEKIFKIRS